MGFSKIVFFLTGAATTEIYPLSLHDALPIWRPRATWSRYGCTTTTSRTASRSDRKSTRLKSSHSSISYAVLCLKKKKATRETTHHHFMLHVTLLPVTLLLLYGPFGADGSTRR